jgi:hypothetical protein
MQTTSNLSFRRHILIFKLIDLNILNKILGPSSVLLKEVFI